MINIRRLVGCPVLGAISRSFAIIEFDPRGKILCANENFLAVVGYAEQEIVGKHHSMFMQSEEAASPDYAQFWSKLGRGETQSGAFSRVAKNGRTVWIQASYSPVLTRSGRVKRIVKVAADITVAKMDALQNQGMLDAVSRSQAVITFTPAGEILDANNNFLATVGYSKAEIVGQHHRMFMDPEEARSSEYVEFWAQLARGDFVAKEFRRLGKGGREVWLQASYNPIFDVNRKVVKVVKIATDLSERMQSISSLGHGLSCLSEGDLTTRIEQRLSGTVDQLRKDYNTVVDKLGESIGCLTDSAGVISANTAEISTNIDTLSKRTEQQAASLEQTAAALDQITATSKKAAEGAQHARDVTAIAKDDAEGTSKVVRRTIDAMERIEKSAEKINQIIGVIDEIAFQTNLLALNAGVEAARAGDAGRGFAVVASEVRALAQRSAGAAKEIKALISTSATQVADGVNLVAETGRALDNIMGRVTQINTIIADIASGAQEQATGLQQVNVALNQLDQTTQQNAAMVEEVTASTHAVAAESRQLATLADQFKVKGAAGHSRHFSNGRPSDIRGAAPIGARVASGGQASTRYEGSKGRVAMAG